MPDDILGILNLPDAQEISAVGLGRFRFVHIFTILKPRQKNVKKNGSLRQYLRMFEGVLAGEVRLNQISPTNREIQISKR